MTLVEALVAGTIGAIVAGAVLTVVNVQSREVAEATVHSILQVQAETVYGEIARMVREGNRAYPPGPEAFNDEPVSDIVVRISDQGNNRIGEFRIKDGMLWEWSHDLLKLIPMQIGEDTIFISESSNFSFSADRKRVSPSLRLKTWYNGKAYSMMPLGGQYACRN